MRQQDVVMDRRLLGDRAGAPLSFFERIAQTMLAPYTWSQLNKTTKAKVSKLYVV